MKKNSIGVSLGADVIKRAENAIFRRAISAIKPKHIEIKLRPERRVLLDSSAERDETEEAKKGSEQDLKTCIVLERAKFNPLADPKLDGDEKKKSVRERLGDKIEPEMTVGRSDDKLKDDKGKDKAKKDKRISPTKDKVNLLHHFSMALHLYVIPYHLSLFYYVLSITIAVFFVHYITSVLLVFAFIVAFFSIISTTIHSTII